MANTFWNPRMVTAQTFWSRYKVIIMGAFTATFTALAPVLLLPSRTWDTKALIVAGCLALGGYLAREARGKNWTIVGQVAAGIIAFSAAYEGDFDLPRMMIAIAVAVFAIPIPPVKLSTYEHATPIVKAKAEAEVIKDARNKEEAPKENKDFGVL